MAFRATGLAAASGRADDMTIAGDLLTMLAVSALFCGMLSGFIALSKGRSWLGFAMIGILLGPFGLVATGFAKPAAPTIRVLGEDPHDHEEPPPQRSGERPS
jgi:hypothetical protein